MHCLSAQIAHPIAGIDHRILGKWLFVLRTREHIVIVGFASTTAQEFHDLNRQGYEMLALHFHSLTRQSPKRISPFQIFKFLPGCKAGFISSRSGEQCEHQRITGCLATARCALPVIGCNRLNEIGKLCKRYAYHVLDWRFWFECVVQASSGVARRPSASDREPVDLTDSLFEPSTDIQRTTCLDTPNHC